MRLFITGATGLIGRRLVLDRLERGDQVVLLSRDVGRAANLFAADANRNITVVQGNPAAPGAWQESVDGCDAVVHLAGAGIAERRWSAAYKKFLVSSRIDSTHQVAQAIQVARIRPRVLINASAAGYYGEAGDRELDESARPGNDFLAQLCIAWEEQALRVESASAGATRVVLLRSGVVLDERGGAMSKMLTPFQFFMGGPLGSGRQFMPWIHWRDLIGLIDLALEERELSGPLNMAAPQPVRNREFSRALGQALNRPSWLPKPKFLLRLVAGEVARFLTTSQRVVPAKAQQFGYVFVYPDVDMALEALLGSQDDATLMTSDAAGANPPDVLNLGPRPLPVEASPPLVKNNARPRAPIRLMAIDVDGTLLNSDGSIAQGVIQACRAAERAGCVVVLATARPPRGLRTILQTLDLTSPTINYNGAVIWNPQDGRPQYHEPLPAELARQIIQESLALQAELLVSLEVLDRWYVDRIDPRFEPQNGRMLEPDYVGSLDQFLQSPVTKVNLVGIPEQIQPVLEMIRERFWRPRNVAVFLTDPRLIQITHPMVDKGIALQRIAKRMGLSRDEVMAIGDASNDMGMIEWAGFGVAVANAYPPVKELADAIVPSNDELGVARAIQRYVLAKR
jgi:hypothetical protein